MSSSKKLLVVFGATGQQGGAVIKTVLSTPALSSQYTIRGITRDTSKPSAQALAAKGVELAAANMDDPSSLQQALAGAFSVFCVTNFWESMSEAVEVQQGKNVADAAKAVGVKQLICSTLPHVGRMTGGKLTGMKHFESKADIQAYAESIKSGSFKTAFFQPGFYMQNIKGFLRPGEDDSLVLTLPMHPTETQIPYLDSAQDTGKYVAPALANPDAFDGVELRGFSEWGTPQQTVDTIAAASGKKVVFNEVSQEAFAKNLPAAIADELSENMVLIRDYSYYGVKGREPEVLAEVMRETKGYKLTSWADFVAAQGPW